ncbi:MAG: hypothetical protein ACLR9P_00395 [Escherichia coli]
MGDTLWLTGVNKPMRVQASRAKPAVEQAHAGQRIALNVPVMPKRPAPRRLAAGRRAAEPLNGSSFHSRPTPLTQWQPLHIHRAASHITGRVSLLENDPPDGVRLRLAGG